jgi:hypothetical protein
VEVTQLAAVVAQQVAEEVALNQSFEAKVSQEIDADPQIIKLREAADAAQAEADRLRSRLNRKTARMRKTREDKWDAYRYVATEREL